MPDQIELGPASRVNKLIQDYEEQRSARRNFESYWQTLHDYFYLESSDINRTYSLGNELNPAFLWDATTLEAADVFASGFMNYLTPPSSIWFRLKHRNPALAENRTVNVFLEDVSREVNYALNRSNFYDQMFPAYKSSGVYGTAAIYAEEDIDDDIRFYNMPLKQVILVEDAAGRIAKFFIEFEFTAEQAEGKWGRAALSSELQMQLREGKGKTEKHKFLLYIGKRIERDPRRDDKLNLPIEALWIDLKAKRTIDESGYHEFPAFAHRFDRRPFIAWGFSPAMKALPFARMLNAIAKTNLRALMKHTDPPVAVPHNAFIAPLNMNPRAVNTYKKTAMDSAKDIFAFGNFGNPEAGLKAIEYYAAQVKSLMYQDVFLAFQQITKDMNNPEIMERINEKMTLLGPAVGRYLDEALSPIVLRTIGILARRGKLPEPPVEMLLDPRFEIDFVSTLAQAQRRNELNTLVTGLTLVGQMAQFAPDVLDNIDPDKATHEVWEITGAPASVLRDDAEIEKIRQSRINQMQAQEQMAALGTSAEIAKTVSEAEAKMKQGMAESE